MGSFGTSITLINNNYLSTTIVIIQIIYLHCVAVSEALSWFAPTNRQGADMCKRLLKAQQPCTLVIISAPKRHSHHYEQLFSWPFFEICVCCGSCPNSLSTPPGHHQVFNDCIRLDAEWKAWMLLHSSQLLIMAIIALNVAVTSWFSEFIFYFFFSLKC